MAGPGRAAASSAVTATAAAAVAVAAIWSGRWAAGPGPARWAAVEGWTRPVVDAAAAAAAALTIGLLVLVATALPRPRTTDRAGTPAAGSASDPAPGSASDPAAGSASDPAAGSASDPAAASWRARRLVAWTSAAWGALALAQALLDHGADPAAGHRLHPDHGRGLLLTAAVAAVICALSVTPRLVAPVGWLCLLSLVPLVPAAATAVPEGIIDRDTAVTALGLHLIGVSVWLGGLAGVAALRRPLGAAWPAVVSRYARLATWATALVALSGVVGTAVRIPRIADLGTGYGAVVLVKAVALGCLAVAGSRWRRRAARPGHGAVRLVAVELAALAGLLGLGVALAGSTPPGADSRRVRSVVEAVTAYPMPPRLTAARWFTQWQPDLLWTLVAVACAAGYLAGAHRLRARGDRWSPACTASWLVGLAGLVYVTSGAPAVYGRVLFSMHMLGHMSLSMVVPVFLVLGSPVTLALRALPARHDGSRGPREWLVVATASRVARVLAFPPVAAFLFAGSLLFFYFSPLFGLALSTHVGLELMYAHFLFAGYLFAWVLVGLDPRPAPVSQPLRLITLLGAMAFHAFFGVALLSGSGLLANDYFGRLDRPWGPGLLADQRLAGGVAWGIGDVPAILMAVILAIEWARDDDREARRLDRAADRDGDAQLTAYNAMLARLAGEPPGDDAPGHRHTGE